MKKTIKKIPIDPILDKLIKLAPPKISKTPTQTRKFKLTENSIVVGKTPIYIRQLEPTSKYRFPIDKAAYEKVMKIYERERTYGK